ncbi:Calcium ion-binding protein [Thalictrum thalictroides]|uniref:Calcium ion-binding protein n=1 Tax=Thalictrum thalictroides TaxID=46969 RepID=A0A7J6WZM7_THATH|nr:Calcium ion-binding protein [Thalictrum thalictroides]
MFGLPSVQMLNVLTDTLYKQFIEKDIHDFEEFHIAMLDIFITFNSALPGMHYDVPQRKDVEECFKEWNEKRERKIIEEFMVKCVHHSKLDDYTMIAGMATPPAAMALKRVGETVPQLSMIKVIPDVIFVPSATLLALISVKLTRRINLRKHIG